MAPEGVVPDTVIWSFYVGAAILICCVVYTTLSVKEWNPKEYAEYNGGGQKDSANWLVLLKNAPSTFWRVGLVQFFCWSAFLYMWTYVVDAVSLTVWGTADAETAAYQEAGNWTGVLYAVQAIGSVAWAMVLPRFANRKMAYSVSLLIGAVGFALIPLFHYSFPVAVVDAPTSEAFTLMVHAKYLQFIPFLLIGCAWAAMLAMPFTFVTNALQGRGHMGAYLGLFNGTICLPQIAAALLGGQILHLVGSVQSNMMYVAGGLLLVGALCVFAIKDK